MTPVKMIVDTRQIRHEPCEDSCWYNAALHTSCSCQPTTSALAAAAYKLSSKLKRIDLSAHVLKLIHSSTLKGAIPIVLAPRARYAIL